MMRNKNRQFYATPVNLSYLSLLLVFIFGCKHADPVSIDLEPAASDPPPYLAVSYGREETQGSNGLLENVSFTLSHTINGNLLDYGRVSCGGVALWIDSLPEGERFYYSYLQGDIPGREFRPEFRFASERLSFTARESPMIEDIDVELRVPRVSYLVNITQGQTVNPEQDWFIEVNQEVFGVEISMQPIDPVEGFDESDIIIMLIPKSIKTIRIPASRLQALKSLSRGNRYIMVFNHSTQPDEYRVRGKRSDKSIAVPVYASSSHTIDFVMVN